MKQLTRFAVLLFGMALLIPSCQKAPELTITSSPTVELNVDGSSGMITFTANRAWTVSSSDSWVTISPSSGEASDKPVTVTVRCNANTTYDDRTATVTIRMEDLSQSVTIKQPANKGVVLPKQVFDLQSDAKSIDVEVQANVQYTVTTSVDWIKQTGTKGLTSKTLTFSIEENKTYDPREGKITIKPQEGNAQEQVISVKQAQKDALNVEKTSYDMPYGGGEIEIKVESNVSFDVTPNADWIHYTQTKALNSSTVCLTIDENTTYSSRQGTVEIKQQNGSLKHTITVNQAGRIAVTSVVLDKTSLKLNVGDSETLVATVKPDNATDKTVICTSSDDTVATVDETGKVTAVKEGTATITAKAGEKTAECKVTVYVAVTSVELNKTTLSIIEGESETLTATVKPDNATDKTVTWTSSDEKIATVKDGKVTAVKVGEAKITATAGDKSAECKVTVSPVPVSSVTLDHTSLDLEIGETATLVATVKPDNAADKTVTWSTSYATVASVDENGVVSARSEGQVIITAKAGDKNATCTVTVKMIEGAVDLGIVLNRADGSQYRVFYRDRNIGASNPEDAGNHYAWGEIETKSDYSWATYKWGNGTKGMYTKYCPTEQQEHWAGSGSPDGKLVLDHEDDAAHVVLGGLWKTPSLVELLALFYHCNWSWTTVNGVKGYKVWTTINHEQRSIFLPVTGWYKGSALEDSGYGYYWASTLDAEYDGGGSISFYYVDKFFGYDDRSRGYAIRPIIEVDL